MTDENPTNVAIGSYNETSPQVFLNPFNLVPHQLWMVEGLAYSHVDLLRIDISLEPYTQRTRMKTDNKGRAPTISPDTEAAEITLEIEHRTKVGFGSWSA